MAEAAEYLGVSRGTLYAWVSAGRIKAHKLAPIEKSGRGAASRFYLSELEKWVKEQ
ncbi:DNA binding domain protein, excisionase family [Treponema socranskii subsp. socranskii VPI DR56BR1116 = ATCC 35536]|uniref:DNA binding domain protein, excisionase family n=2 Tax=Treponema socranskii TaxID=53419 RepID=A0ABP2YPH4_TRESO|nr:DNA binding domain protein, excisionase family [Treponema socranskii subsp. socranskii VPI DR56BR1116 = ATCC 35536]